MNTTNEVMGLKPAGYDKNGPYYDKSGVVESVFKSIMADDFFNRKVKSMNNDVKAATEKLDLMTGEFGQALNKFIKQESALVEQIKKSSGTVRDTLDKLSAGWSKFDKVVNFDKLERQVELLERASKAMTVLAELEASGKLEKITNSLK